MICFYKLNPSCASFAFPHISNYKLGQAVQFIRILFVYDEELKWGRQGYSLCLLANRLSCNCSRPGVNVHVHLLRKNLSRNFSSIRSGPISPACAKFSSSLEYIKIVSANMRRSFIGVILSCLPNSSKVVHLGTKYSHFQEMGSFL